MTLAEFLLARIAEDEAAVTSPHENDAWGPGLAWMGLWIEGMAITISSERVLAECAAKRRIVEEHVGVECSNVRHPGGEHCAVCSYDEIPREWMPCPTLRILAAVYSDHPDYDPAGRA